jgi:hypothetical protein
MASQPVTYGSVIGDGQQTVTLAGAVVELVGRPISGLWRRRSAVQELREKLGEWAKEAVDANGRWLQPVLRYTAFEDHLINKNGYFEPSGECKASFGWAHLLYALDIRPGGEVLAWRLLTDGSDAAASCQISLDIDGKALCHIINLYRIYRSSTPSVFAQDHPIIQLPFGTISIQNKETDVVALFKPGTPKELSAIRLPFSYHVRHFPGTQMQLPFDQDTILTRYFNAIDHGISDTTAVLPLPSDSLVERVRALTRGLQLIRGSEWKSSYLLTQSWLEEASRINRRATTNGGGDFSLIEDVIESLKKSGANSALAEIADHNSWENGARRWMKTILMTQESAYKCVWNGRSESSSWGSSESRMRGIIMAELSSVLEQYAELPEWSWKHALSKVIPEILSLLETSHVMLNEPLVVLEFSPESPLWTLDCHFQG